jgi:hypothetical protein
MAHQAFKGCAVNAPVMFPQFKGMVLVEIQCIHDVLCHGFVHDGKYV